MRVLPGLGILLAGWLTARPAAAQPAAVRTRLQRATVTVLAARPLRGLVLAGDGRILTALSAGTPPGNLRVRYPDGRVDRAQVVVVDSAWGVALLEGAAGHWPEGLALPAAEGRSGQAVIWTTPQGRAVSGTLRRRRTFVGLNGILLRDAWELEPAPAAAAVGAGVVAADTGQVVALVVPPPAEATPGAAGVPFGVPLPVLRDLCMQAGEPTRPFLGLVARELQPGEGAVAAAEGGVRITTVSPDGPAQRAGLQAGDAADVIIGVDEHPVRSVGDLGRVLAGHRAGDIIIVHIVRSGVQVDVPLQLEAFHATAPTVAPRP